MKNECPTSDFTLKSYFLAPHSENKKIVQDLISGCLQELFKWRENSFKNDELVIPKKEKQHKKYKKNVYHLSHELKILQKMFQNEIPRHSPRYMAHMFSEYSIPALLGHFLGLLYNPNNISSESSVVGSKIEKMAIRELAKMINYPSSSIGHFTSGGTIANIEMLYRFKHKIQRPEKYALLIPTTAHYSWCKGIDLVGLEKKSTYFIETDSEGSVVAPDLEKKLHTLIKKGVKQIAIVSIFGNTEFGTVDPIFEIASSIKKLKNKDIFIWHHIDAAYGAFYATLKNSKIVSRSFIRNIKSLKLSDSITIDPHKLGYVPYASGCFICRDEDAYRVINNSAPYVDFKSKSEPGPYTIEGSRSAAGAIATLLSAKTLGFKTTGLGRIIEKNIETTNKIKIALTKSKSIYVLNLRNSNILCFFILDKTRRLSACNKLTHHLYDTIRNDKDKKSRFYVSKTILDDKYKNMTKAICREANIKSDTDQFFLIRCTIMNPFIKSKHYKKSLINEFVNYINLCIK